MWKQLQRSSDLPSPDSNYAHWQHLIRSHPKYWKRLIRRAVTHEVLRTQRVWRVQEFHLHALRRLETIFGVPSQCLPATVEASTVTSFGCMQCRIGCASKGGKPLTCSNDMDRLQPLVGSSQSPLVRLA